MSLFLIPDKLDKFGDLYISAWTISVLLFTLGPQLFTQPMANDDLWFLGSPLMTHWLGKNTREFLQFSQVQKPYGHEVEI